MNASQQVKLREPIPKSVEDIAEVFGLAFVEKLVRYFGGVELRIPHKLSDEHMLMVLGLDDAKALCEYCPEDTILVPKSLDRKSRFREARELEEQGFKRWQIARRLGITQRHVRRLLNGEDGPDPNQLDFFD